MHLYVLRHAKAENGTPGQADRERSLAPRGVDAAQRVADYFEATGIRCDAALVSPAVRTRQTFGLVRAALGDPETRLEERLYAAPAERIAAVIGELEPSVVSVIVVGHNPGVHQLAFDLAGDGEPSAMDGLRSGFPTAALASLRIDGPTWDLTVGSGYLESFVVPRG